MLAIRLRSSACWTQWSNRRQHGYSTKASTAQHIEVTSAAGQHVALDVYEPTARQLSSTDAKTCSALIYFTRGSVLHDNSADEAAIKTLQSILADSHIVSIRSELNQKQHPQQIYDAVAAFDWTVDNILPERAIRRAGRATHLGRIATCGELYGGGLATMLALTECKIGQPRICAAALNNPIVDWSDISSAASTQRRRADKRMQTLIADPQLDSDLEVTRSQLFKNDSARLDIHASPILLFRSCGSPVASSSNVARDGDAQFDGDVGVPAHSTTSVDSTNIGLVETTANRGPRYSHQFPSRSLNLKLPDFHICTGTVEPLHKQGLELSKQLEMSIARQRRPSKRERRAAEPEWIYDHEDEVDGSDDFKLHAIDLAKLSYSLQPGLSLWDSTSEGQARLSVAAQWLNSRLTGSG